MQQGPEPGSEWPWYEASCGSVVLSNNGSRVVGIPYEEKHCCRERPCGVASWREFYSQCSGRLGGSLCNCCGRVNCCRCGEHLHNWHGRIHGCKRWAWHGIISINK